MISGEERFKQLADALRSGWLFPGKVYCQALFECPELGNTQQNRPGVQSGSSRFGSTLSGDPGTMTRGDADAPVTPPPHHFCRPRRNLMMRMMVVEVEVWLVVMVSGSPG